MYSLSQVAAICQIPVQTLRFYDKTGLVKSNDERYTDADLVRIQMIQDFRALDFSLEQIRTMMDVAEPGWQLMQYQQKYYELENRRNRITEAMNEVSGRIDRFKLQLRFRQYLTSFQTFVEVVDFPARHLLSARDNGENTRQEQFSHLLFQLQTKQISSFGPLLAIHEIDGLTFGITIEDEEEATTTIPAGRYLCLLHGGAADDEQGRELMGFAEASLQEDGFTIAGPIVEHELHDDKTLIQIQIPFC